MGFFYYYYYLLLLDIIQESPGMGDLIVDEAAFL